MRRDSLRATTATLLLDAGVDIRKVQHLLDHSHITRRCTDLICTCSIRASIVAIAFNCCGWPHEDASARSRNADRLSKSVMALLPPLSNWSREEYRSGHESPWLG